MPVLHRDFETCSNLQLPDVGAYAYAANSTTDVRCCAFAVDAGEVKLWTPGEPIPAEFIEAANSTDWTVSAFHDAFERLIETNDEGVTDSLDL